MRHLKSIFLALTLICLTATSYGQAAIPKTPPAPITGVTGTRYPSWDTLIAAGIITKTFVDGGDKSLMAIQVNVKKISGTVAGWIDIRASLDTGATYTTIASVALKDTAGTKGYYFHYDYNPSYYWSAAITTTGTSSIATTVWKLPRP